MGDVKLNIAGRIYDVHCEDGQEQQLIGLAAIVDEKVRAMPGGTAPKVIFCTTESEMSNIMLALSAGADEYVMKPFDAEIIKGKLQQVGLL